MATLREDKLQTELAAFEQEWRLRETKKRAFSSKKILICIPILIGFLAWLFPDPLKSLFSGDSIKVTDNRITDSIRIAQQQRLIDSISTVSKSLVHQLNLTVAANVAEKDNSNEKSDHPATSNYTSVQSQSDRDITKKVEPQKNRFVASAKQYEKSSSIKAEPANVSKAASINWQNNNQNQVKAIPPTVKKKPTTTYSYESQIKAEPVVVNTAALPKKANSTFRNAPQKKVVVNNNYSSNRNCAAPRPVVHSPAYLVPRPPCQQIQIHQRYTSHSTYSVTRQVVTVRR